MTTPAEEFEQILTRATTTAPAEQQSAPAPEGPRRPRPDLSQAAHTRQPEPAPHPLAKLAELANRPRRGDQGWHDLTDHRLDSF